MVGRPRTRAKRAAEDAARAEALLAQVNDASRNATERHSAQQALRELQAQMRPQTQIAIGKADPALDRENLAAFWRQQIEYIDQASTERRDLLIQVAEHPSPLFAREARTFGLAGTPKGVVAAYLEISEAQFELHYAQEYAIGNALAFRQVATNFMRIAMSTNDRTAMRAALEFLSRRGGDDWKPPAQKVEIDDSRKGKKNVIDTSQMSWEDRQAMRRIIERAMLRTGSVEGEVVRGGVVPQIQSDADEEEGE